MISLFLILLFSLFAIISSDKDIESFLSWFTSNGGVLNDVSIAEFEGMGRGVLTKRDISENELIILVPSKLIFSKRSMLQSIDLIHKEIMLSIHSSDDAIIACLLTEKYKGEKSFFEPYIKVLPKYVPNLSRFSDDESIEIQDNLLEEQVRQQKKQKVDAYNTFLDIIPKLWKKYNIDINIIDITFNDYLWAASIIDSRGLRFQGQVHLAPFADMFNYKPHSSQREFDSGNFFLEHHRISEDTGSLTVLADQSQVSNKQLFEDYGDNSDQIYLQYHGFVPDINPFRCVNLKTPDTDNIEEEYIRVFIGKVFGRRHLEYCVPSTGKLSISLEVYIAIWLMNESEANKCTDIMNKEYSKYNNREKFPVFEIITQKCARKTLNLLANIRENRATTYTNNDKYKKLLDRLDSIIRASKPDYLTSIEDDKTLLDTLVQDYESNVHKILAVKYRLYAKKTWEEVSNIYGTNRNSSNINTNSNKESVTKSDVSELDQKLLLFNEWFSSHEPKVNKLKAISMPIYRIGTVATEDINFKDDYLAVPINIIMDSASAESDMNGIGVLLKSLYDTFKQSDDFHGLLFFLIYERFINMERSVYWPYLQLLPLSHELDIPLLWNTDDTNKRLKPSSTLQSILEYQSSVKKLYDKISSLDAVKSFFPSEIFTYDNYRWATAILDSRSIWWSGKRHLVPMLDFINCIEGPKESTVHTTSLDDTGKYALTKAPWSFKQGEQLFENYGQPNHIYYTYHGFILPINSHDCVSFDLSMTSNEMNTINWNEDKVRGIANYIRLPKSGILNSCLAYPVPEKIWLYLSLKNNKIDNNSDKPNQQNAQTLIDMIDIHLSKYNNYENDNHYSSENFIKSEESLLKGIKSKLMIEYKKKDEL